LTDCIICSAWHLTKKNFENTQEHERFVKGIIEFMNTKIDAKCVKLDSSLAKHIPIADPSLGHNFLAQIKWHYDLCYEKPQMNKKNFNIL
jgi:hypothetical protein